MSYDWATIARLCSYFGCAQRKMPIYRPMATTVFAVLCKAMTRTAAHCAATGEMRLISAILAGIAAIGWPGSAAKRSG